jgi:hypothetical protein
MAAVAAPTQAGPLPGHRSTAPSIEAVRLAFPQLEILELIGQGGMGAVKHFLANRYFAASCEKRGRNVIHEPLAPGTDTAAGPEIPDPAVLPPDEIFGPFGSGFRVGPGDG